MAKSISFSIYNAKLKEIRNELKCTRKDLSRWTRISQQMLYHYETEPNINNPSSRYYSPSIEEIIILCEVLNCKPKEIVCEDKYEDFLEASKDIAPTLVNPVSFEQYNLDLLALQCIINNLKITHKNAPLRPLVIALNTLLGFDNSQQEQVIDYINKISCCNDDLSETQTS